MGVVKFYNSLGINGLSHILDEASNQAYYDYITSHLLNGNILDLGCGYGRVAKPLMEHGFDVEGIDIMDMFIEYANKTTNSNKFKIGNMLNIAYPENSFMNIICLWSTFNHFLTIGNQLIVIKEIIRVLKKGGKAIIDVPTPEVYQTPSFQKIVTSSPSENHICDYEVNGIPNSDFVHNEETLEELIQTVTVSACKIERVKLDKLPRLILTFTK